MLRIYSLVVITISTNSTKSKSQSKSDSDSDTARESADHCLPAVSEVETVEKREQMAFSAGEFFDRRQHYQFFPVVARPHFIRSCRGNSGHGRSVRDFASRSYLLRSVAQRGSRLSAWRHSLFLGFVQASDLATLRGNGCGFHFCVVGHRCGQIIDIRFRA